MEKIKAKTTGGRDWQAGYRDACGGFYDKWYRKNRRDQGAAYDAGFDYAKKIGRSNKRGCAVIECQ